MGLLLGLIKKSSINVLRSDGPVKYRVDFQFSSEKNLLKSRFMFTTDPNPNLTIYINLFLY